MKITEELIDYVADLSRLWLSSEEKEQAKDDLTDVLDYVEKLNELNTVGMPELSQPFDDTSRYREDEVTGCDQRESVFANAPERKGDYFKVFRTVD